MDKIRQIQTARRSNTNSGLMMMKFFLLLIFNLLLVSAFAQQSGNAEKVASVRKFDRAALQKYNADKDFSYGEIRGNVSRSLWERFWRWFWDLFRESSDKVASGKVVKYILIGLGCAALVFLLIKLSGMDANYLFAGKSKEIELPFQENLENIHEISFDQSIETALQNRDYRLAVRLLYLKSLKRLNDNGRIIWQPEKTNSAYVNELVNTSQQQRFRDLTHKFEYVWYGSFPVDENAYAKIQQSFSEFNSSR